MMKNDNKKKGNPTKKILPAAGMLALSASMLATSTYAWFTMSREVEVKNIQMTASVPEDLQISLGQLTNLKASGNPTASEIAAGRSTYLGLQGNQGILLKADTATNADDGNVKAPANDGSAIDNLFWSNTADISEYYRLGKIIPASSIDGKGIFFTPDASGNGTTLKAGAKFYQVADATTSNIYKWDSTNLVYSTSGNGDEARTKLHAITNVTRASDTWNPANGENASTNGYVGAKAWNDTQDDGYYVDIPIWIRSSAKDDTLLSVDAYVTTNAAKTNDASEESDDELYMAARAAIIYGETPNSTGLLRIRKDSLTNTKSIIDYMYTTNSGGDAVSEVANYAPTYDDAVEYNGTAVLAVPGRDESDATKKYGTMVKAVVRVWLEGEDPNCWNPNAGQDFNISLKFVKGAIGDTETAANNANGVLYPAAYAKGTAANANVVDVVNGTKVTITSTTKNGDTNGTLEFTYDGNKWNQTGGSFEVLDGWTYQITGTGKTAGTVTGADEIAAWLKTNVTKQADVADTVTYSITETDTNASQQGGDNP